MVQDSPITRGSFSRLANSNERQSRARQLMVKGE